MVNTWIFALFIGLASSASALDADFVAEKVIQRLNVVLQTHESQWPALPGFDIQFKNKNESKWHIHYGRIVAIGGAEKDNNGNEPQIVHFMEDSSAVVFDVNLKNLNVEYKFSCEDFFEISGYTYSISRSVPTQATIIVDIQPEGPSQCRGFVHSTPVSFSYEEDRSDFGRIIPDDQYAKQCVIRSYTKRQEYTDPITKQFEDSYGDVVEKVLRLATQDALDNLNLCSE